MIQFKDLAKSQYSPINQCIYCGETEKLTREHIVPYGLSGTAVLPKASCPACADITKRFEQDVLRGPMWAVRIYRQLKSRRKHKGGPVSLPITVIKNGKDEIVNLPLHQYPILLHFPIFSLPSLFAPEGYKIGINMTGVATISFGADPVEVAKILKADGIKITQHYKPIAFARMIAKIAYCWAYAEGHLNKIRGKSTVLPAILGRKNDIGMWVGTTTYPIENQSKMLHKLWIDRNEELGVLTARLQLFADSDTPVYDVVLGYLH